MCFVYFVNCSSGSRSTVFSKSCDPVVALKVTHSNRNGIVASRICFETLLRLFKSVVFAISTS